jgi:5-methylcytosine-specific restriction endonuclease McrA
MPRKRVPGGPTDKGYGVAHRRVRAMFLAAWMPGVTPCARCGEPMWGPPRMLHLDHDDDRTGYVGLSHSWCNLRAAAEKTNRQRGKPLTRAQQAAIALKAPPAAERHSRVW